MQKGQILFVIDQPRYQQALAEAEADVAYYQTLAAEKQRESSRRHRLGIQALSQEEIDQASNVLQTVQHQLAKAIAVRDLARLDLERTTVRAPAEGWVTNLNVHAGEFINRGATAVALVKKDTFYILAYLEETKLEGVKPGYRAEITRWAVTASCMVRSIAFQPVLPIAVAVPTAKGWRPLIIILNGYAWRNGYR